MKESIGCSAQNPKLKTISAQELAWKKNQKLVLILEELNNANQKRFDKLKFPGREEFRQDFKKEIETHITTQAQ